MAIEYRKANGEVLSSKDIHDYSVRYDALESKGVPEHLRDSYLGLVDTFGEESAAAIFEFSRDIAQFVVKQVVGEVVKQAVKESGQENANVAYVMALHMAGVL